MPSGCRRQDETRRAPGAQPRWRASGATNWRIQPQLIGTLIFLERRTTVFLQLSAHIYMQITYIRLQGLFSLPPVHAPGHQAGHDLLSKALQELFQPPADGGLVYPHKSPDLRQSPLIQVIGGQD